MAKSDGFYKKCDWTAIAFMDTDEDIISMLIPEDAVFNCIPRSWTNQFSFLVKLFRLSLPDDLALFNTNNNTTHLSVPNFMKDFHPVAIKDISIGSTTGLLQMLEFIRTTITQQNIISVFNVDINIYWRIMRILTKNRNHFLNNHIVNLGWWHPVKIVAEKVFSTYLNIFLGPFFHCLYPSATILKKPRLQQMLPFFRVINAAYTQIRNEMKNHQEFFQTHPENKNYIYFFLLQDLFEFYIPLVLLLHKTIRYDDFNFRLKMLNLILFAVINLDSKSYVYGLLCQIIQIRYFSIILSNFSLFILCFYWFTISVSIFVKTFLHNSIVSCLHKQT